MINYTISTDDNVVVAQATEQFDTFDFILHMGQINEDPRFHTNLNGIYDFSPIKKLTGDPKHLLSLAEEMNKEEYMPNPCRIVTLCPKDNPMYRVLEGYFIMTRGSMLDYRFFDDVNAGLQWINLTPERYQELITSL